MRKIVVIGGGPSGLFFALMARRRLGVDVEVYEQNPRDATFGFGVILAEGGHGAFRDADPEAADAMAAASRMTRDRILSLDGESVEIEGGPWGGAIARIALLNVLQEICERRGVRVTYGERIENPDRFDADLIVGADGVNSVVRRGYEGQFGASSWTLKNRMAWYGTTCHYDKPILSFQRTGKGNFWAVGYSHSDSQSTFVAECDADAWQRSGLCRMTMEERRGFAEGIFARELAGHPLLSNRSDWSSLPVMRCAQWSVGHRVLIGDARCSPHPSIGSGTRIAMEDAIALIRALEAHRHDVPSALAEFQRQHLPQSNKLVLAMEKSFQWYEDVGDKLCSQDVVELAFDYMTRTGRLSESRLRAEYPEFMAQYGSRWEQWRHGREVLNS
ncbi:FAD-dependent monooxygenase [Paraburkholderia kururiensis]|uniref:FAD-dependent monooxygenase n=1 Tax=Paraburkholderia kururiensis TaxID=984307 RepID=UPI00034B404C|nr:FAD-dependent monooxygenase [Paraburkholderia kururiensis]